MAQACRASGSGGCVAPNRYGVAADSGKSRQVVSRRRTETSVFAHPVECFCFELRRQEFAQADAVEGRHSAPYSSFFREDRNLTDNKADLLGVDQKIEDYSASFRIDFEDRSGSRRPRTVRRSRIRSVFI